ncbi:Dihydroorotate dehydrogenase electron transfer subunit [Desulfurella amilsii]|uniref:Dihydroorotate dehydrogenase electron transfer subunit n=1 Tax=Desulfurella amilsii TaxID=1562698 RepID=A0A1X4XZ80_9BACT|nr:dihydroorotate dehydrogenase electron transfer subunit [Desulfurella amilsii]OSS42748.1 Dihydroorotate dehydrogenase electron transfer subunit [Desulfurella amilsii]OSS42824.1 Dihydroorotate dehydrogenase electron transfer subunit [Desulfurella amilsii]
MKTIVLNNDQVAKDTYYLQLQVPEGFKYEPGQFLMLKINKLNEPLLRRPFSIAKVDETIDIYYKVIGLGTNILKSYKKGDLIDFTGPFGNGFDLRNKRIVLCGGGIGVAPLIGLKYFLDSKNITSHCFFGFNSKEDCFVDFGEIATLDGSLGKKGSVVDLLEDLDNSFHVYACGPKGMLKALCELADRKGFSMDISLESNMACGFGVCLGCSINTINGYKQVCKDGPAFNYTEIIW